MNAQKEEQQYRQNKGKKNRTQDVRISIEANQTITIQSRCVLFFSLFSLSFHQQHHRPVYESSVLSDCLSIKYMANILKRDQIYGHRVHEYEYIE